MEQESKITMTELKPCPFCGSKDIKFSAFDAEDDSIIVCMMCRKCEACGPTVEPTPNDGDLEYKKAVRAWNRRAREE